MPSKIYSVELLGIEGRLVEIETDTRNGLPAFTIVGLPDTAVQEAKERVKSAIKNTALPFPRGKVVINLAPADLKKVGARYDVAIALGILSACELVKKDALKGCLFLGELALSGQIRPISGVLPSVAFALKQGFEKVFVPHENAPEATLIKGIKIIPVASLQEVMLHLEGALSCLPVKIKEVPESSAGGLTDFSMIRGQAQAKRALEIAAAGGHNLLLEGAPGAGKSLLAGALNGILPPMTEAEILEVTKIYSVAGLLKKSEHVIHTRPFRKVHHTASGVSLIGGGSGAHPGEITLAHRGVLFLDEVAEFSSSTLETMRQPMEEGLITVSRARASITYPARFTLIAAMNPCPCGYFNIIGAQRACDCHPWKIAKYQKKVSGPLLDRIDIHLSIQPVKIGELTEAGDAESSAVVRSRVEKAAKSAQARLKDTSFLNNAEMNADQIARFCPVNSAGRHFLQKAAEQLGLSARAYFKVIKLARTIADLEENEVITENHIAEALHYRKK